MRSFPILLAMALLGCGAVHSPSKPSAALQCGPDNNYSCPAGLLCYYGQAAGTVFGNCLTPPDRPSGDGGTGQPDMWGMQGPAAGCKSGQGYQISANAAACPGAFSADPSLSACAAGWSACAQNPLSADVCKQPQIFPPNRGCFIGAVRAFDVNVPTESGSMREGWTGAQAQDHRFLLGCGTCVGWSTAANQYGAFTNVIQCDDPIYAFQCPTTVPGKDSDFLKVSNKDQNSGVLCCR